MVAQRLQSDETTISASVIDKISFNTLMAFISKLSKRASHAVYLNIGNLI
jgi:hypothetical protein